MDDLKMGNNPNDPFQQAIRNWFANKYYEWHQKSDIVLTVENGTYTIAFQKIAIADLMEMDDEDGNEPDTAIVTHVRKDGDRWVQDGSWIGSGGQLGDTSYANCTRLLIRDSEFLVWAE